MITDRDNDDRNVSNVLADVWNWMYAACLDRKLGTYPLVCNQVWNLFTGCRNMANYVRHCLRMGKTAATWSQGARMYKHVRNEFPSKYDVLTYRM